MNRATELVEPRLQQTGVIGAYVIGSATRPYRDALSDYDIELVVEDDVYQRMADAERHHYVLDPAHAGRVDHEFYYWSWSEFRRLPEQTRDIFRFAYQHAHILHDPSGRIGDVVAELANMPDSVRQERMKVHYAEFVFACRRLRKTVTRPASEPNALNVHLLAGEALRGLVKLLFVANGSWVPSSHWVAEELRLLPQRNDLHERALEALGEPTPTALDDIVGRVDQWLAEQGEVFQGDVRALAGWLFTNDEGRRALGRWRAQ